MRVTRVLIVEDSPTQRFLLARLLETERDLLVVGQAKDGLEAVEMVERLRPDVISMDMRMPRLDGLNATRHIMNMCPTPIVVVSEAGKSQAAMELLQAGALAAVEKPPAPTDPRYAERRDELLKMLRLMAGVRVIRHWQPDAINSAINNGGSSSRPSPRTESTETLILRMKHDDAQLPMIVGIGASAGGPGALIKLLGGLPADFPLPIVLVQHLSAEFMPGLAQWLNRSCALTVRLAEMNELPHAGIIYVAPGNTHLRVSADKRLVLDSQPGRYRHWPAVDALFTSLAEAYGARAIGVVLTGMGEDGADGLRTMRNAGARTIAQNEETCVVFGMPAAAIALGGAEYVLPLPAIGAALLTLAGTGKPLVRSEH